MLPWSIPKGEFLALDLKLVLYFNCFCQFLHLRLNKRPDILKVIVFTLTSYIY